MKAKELADILLQNPELDVMTWDDMLDCYTSVSRVDNYLSFLSLHFRVKG
jgi:hypothetical protein